MNLLMLSCKQASQLIEKQSVSPLTAKEKVMMKLHKTMCKYCTVYEKQSAQIDVLLNSYLNEQHLLIVNADLKNKILEKLK